MEGRQLYLLLQKFIACVSLFLISPLLLVIWILTRLENGGLFIFVQKRMGKDKKVFNIYKIRTMEKGAEEKRGELMEFNEADFPVFKIYDDPRYTKIGKFLAHSGLDELPQLVNIIKGEMAFVGPRPLPVNEAKKVPKKYNGRFSILPGITSLWVVRGAHVLSFDKWMDSDIEYVENRNFSLDLKIACLTILIIIRTMVDQVYRLFTSACRNKIIILLEAFLFIVMFVAGLGVEKNLVQYIGLLTALMVLVIAAYFKKSIKVPSEFFPFLLFLFFLFINIFWSGNVDATFEYIVLFASGGAFYLGFYNLKSKLEKHFPLMIFALGVLWGGLFLLNYLSENPSVNSWSLHLAYTGLFDHFHIGDYWAVLLVLATYFYEKTGKKYYLAVVLAVVVFLALALSRSAYVSAAAGLVLIFSERLNVLKNKRVVITGLIVLAALFIAVGTKKPTLINRQYYLQGLAGFYHKPFGVGVGNFSQTSENPENHVLGLSGYSSIAHDIVLEMLTGMGIFAFFFIVWIYKVCKDILGDNKVNSYNLTAVTLGVNFLFDSTYFIPAMLWIWFISMGLAETKK